MYDGIAWLVAWTGLGEPEDLKSLHILPVPPCRVYIAWPLSDCKWPISAACRGGIQTLVSWVHAPQLYPQYAGMMVQVAAQQAAFMHLQQAQMQQAAAFQLQMQAAAAANWGTNPRPYMAHMPTMWSMNMGMHPYNHAWAAAGFPQ